MRQLSPMTNLLLAVLAGIGLLGSLSLPWYAAPATDPNPTDGPVERGAYQVGQVFSTGAKGMVDGTDAVGGGQVALLIAVGVIAVLALAISANLARRHAEDLLRPVAFAVPVITVVLAILHPGTEATLRLHYGMLVGIAAAVLTTSAAYHGASMRAKKAAPVRPRYGSVR